MVKKPFVSSQNISLREASKIVGCHPDYLSYLIRRKEIKGHRIGRDWFTTEKAVKTYFSGKKFLPLNDFLFSKTAKILFIFSAIILLGIGAFLIFNSPAHFQKIEGDFTEEKSFQTKNFSVQRFEEERGEVREIEITTYSLSDDGDIGISIQEKND